MQRFAGRVLGASLWFAATLTGAAAGSTAVPPTWPGDYLALIKALAHSDRLADPDEVGRLLGSNFLPEPYSSSVGIGCSAAGGTRSHEIVRYKPQDNFWYLKLPPRPGELPPQRKDFHYNISRATYCSGRHAVSPNIDVRINFDYLRGRVCITAQDLTQFLPQAEPTFGVHGSGPYRFSGYTAEEYGVIANLSFDLSGCAREASIWRAESFGDKAKRVRARLNACLSKRAQEPPFKPNDYDFCGGFDALMEQEP